MSYEAIVCRIRTRPHPNADRLQLGTCLGFQVIVGLDTQDNELGVFFPTDGQLGFEFCVANDLCPRFDENGKKIGGGFIDPKHRRVRAQNFRGEKSFGFWVPLEYFEFLYGPYCEPYFEEGMRFTELDYNPQYFSSKDDSGKVQICNKYINPETLRAGGKRKKLRRRETAMFRMHDETEQFKYYKDKFKIGDILTFTYKLHGTSGRYGHVLDDVELNWYQKLLVKLGVPIKTQQWTHLSGSRRVVLEHTDEAGYYGDDTFRYEAIEKIKDNLLKGETIYYEIVGWVNEQTPIMPPVKTKVLNDKEFTEQYGEVMTFTYGCPPGTRKIYVYRITRANEDGHAIDLPWPAVKARCQQLGIEHVPEIPVLRLSSIWPDDTINTPKGEILHNSLIYTGNLSWLESTVEDFTSGEDPLDPTHIREGIVIRRDNGLVTEWYKNKSYEFYVLEGVIKDSDAVDIEEAS